MAALGVCLLIAGCTPKMDWRDVRQESAGWKATFPDKPVEVSRKITLGASQNVVTLTLKSARIDDVMFAVGWIDNAQPGTAGHLQQAMLANLQATPDSVRRKSLQIQGRAAQEMEADGLMRTDPVAPAVAARLWMRTVETPDKRVIEIIVVGPASRIKEDDARQFIDSLQLL